MFNVGRRLIGEFGTKEREEILNCFQIRNESNEWENGDKFVKATKLRKRTLEWDSLWLWSRFK